nr:hypothetical protein [Tanacetum cinerariifolium]
VVNPKVGKHSMLADLANSTYKGCLVLKEVFMGIDYEEQEVFNKVFSTWMDFGGNTRDWGSFGEETNKITDLYKSLEDLCKQCGDGVVGIKGRRCDLYGDGVRNLATASRRGRLKEDLESSTWR